MLLLLTINLLKYRVLYTTKTKATVKNCSTVIFVSLSKSWILVKLSKNFIQRWNWSLSLHLLQFVVSWLSPAHVFTVLIKHWLSSASIHAKWSSLSRSGTTLSIVHGVVCEVETVKLEFIDWHKSLEL